jgi:hypothetical protein
LGLQRKRLDVLGARANVIAENIERTTPGEPPLNAIPPIG